MSLRSNGSYIGYNRVTTTSQDSASGIWSLAAAERRRRAAAWPPSDLDPYFAYVSLLLHMDGSGTTFTDSSSNGYAVTAFGDAAVSTAQAKFGQSCRLDGTGDYLRAPVAAVSIAADTPFAVEMWVYLTAAQSGYMMLLGDDNAGGSKYLAISSTGLEAQFGGTAGTIATCTQSFSQNTWYHIAMTRDSSNVVRMYVDGTSKTVTQGTQSGAFLNQGTYGFIGAWGYTTDPYRLNGYIDDLRITKGTARGYTGSTITVPTAAFPDTGPWTPATLTGLQLWLDASDASTLYDATSGGSLVAADGSVARWEDKSGNARHATQGTSANRPLRKTAQVNGLDALDFDGSNDRLEANSVASFFSGVNKAFTILGVAKTDSTGSLQDFFAIGNSGNNDQNIRASWNNGSQKLVINREGPSGGGTKTVVGGTNLGTAATVATWLFNGSTGRLFVNGSSDATAADLTQAADININVAAVGCLPRLDPAVFFNGLIGEVIVYDTALSDTDREAVENYLLAKWAIT